MPDAPVAIVTGASAGIGLHTAIGLGRAGMRVVMVGRDRARTAAAARQVEGAETELADFASLAEIRRLAENLLERCPRIDVLVNNAGLISPVRANSVDGHELTVAVNHLAPFLLTNLLLDRLKASAPARIINVASTAHKGAWLDPQTMTDPPDWTPLSAYGRSKLANVVFTRTLARRLAGTGVVAVCLHPGVIATRIGDRAGGLAALGWRLAKPFLTRPAEGAATSIFLATMPNPTLVAGAYVVGRQVVDPDPAARDDRLGDSLWRVSAGYVGLPED